MLTTLEVFNPRVTVPPFYISTTDPESVDPLQVLNIDGLGPVEAAVNTSGYSSLDGEFYNGSNVGKRNIVLTLRSNPDWSTQTHESLRQAIYRYFMPKSKVTLQLTSSHMEQVAIDGIVETCEPNLFAKDPTFEISIICPQPAFVSTRTQNIHGVTVLPDNPAVTTLEYVGTYDNGFVLDITDTTVHFHGQDIRVINTTDEIKTFLLENLSGDISGYPTAFLELSTEGQNKYVEYKRTDGSDSGKISLLKYVAAGSDWLQLKQGSNNFRVVSGIPSQPWVITYKTRYGGI